MSASDASILAQREPIEGSHRTSPDAAPGLVALAGLERLYRRHGAALFRRLSRHVDREEARDLVQEAFVRLAAMTPAKRASIDCPEAFATTVAKNALRDRARAAARQAANRQRLVDADAGMANDPHELMEDREALRAVERALSRMNSRRRRIFMLHRFENLTYAEVGIEVGMSEKGVKKQIAKALFELRQAVDRAA
jgi:RNA polymerase sigma-70 factor (ECF subfamily)